MTTTTGAAPMSAEKVLAVMDADISRYQVSAEIDALTCSDESAKVLRKRVMTMIQARTAVSAMAEREAALVKEVEALRADAERWRWLRDLKCCSMTVSRNEGHAPNYMPLSEWIEAQPELYNDVPLDELERMKATGEDWAIQIYPHTPVGFYVYHAATLDAAIDAARAEARDV